MYKNWKILEVFGYTQKSDTQNVSKCSYIIHYKNTETPDELSQRCLTIEILENGKNRQVFHVNIHMRIFTQQIWCFLTVGGVGGGGMGGGPHVAMSIIRNGNVTLLNLRKAPVALSKLRKALVTLSNVRKAPVACH